MKDTFAAKAPHNGLERWESFAVAVGIYGLYLQMLGARLLLALPMLKI